MKIFDHIHGFINICNMGKRIIDTKEFQRLRNIKQLGCVYYVFLSASHNRFEHSLGVYHLTKLYMDNLNKQELTFSKKEYELISISALIHDLGHGPFSHLFDAYVSRTNHEYRSIEIFKMMNQKYDFGYSKDDIEFMYRVIYPDEINDTKRYLYQIVSNKNGIDTDRMDYMLRDLKMTGIENRYNIDYNSMLCIMNNSIVHDNFGCYDIFYKEDIKYLLEMFFQTRYNLYKKICNHKTVKSMEIMMGEILNLTENTFHINKSIQDNDWEKFCYFSDTIVHSLDFLSDKTKTIDQAYKLYNRIKCREHYKLIEEHESHDPLINKQINLMKYNNPDNYIVNRSMIQFYSETYPQFLDENGVEIYKDFFDNRNKNLYLIKVFEK